MLQISTQIIKQIHLICGTTTLGLSIAQFHYLRRARLSANQDLINYSLKFSYRALFACLLLLATAALTGILLVYHIPTLNWQIRWVNVALIAGITSILLIVSQIVLLKKMWWRLFVISNISLWLVMLLIIRDAIFQQTWF